MVFKDTNLLYLVLCLGQRIQAQDWDFPIPIISAAPRSLIPWNGTVKVLCKGTPEAYLYHLEIRRNSEYQVVQSKLGFQEAAEFTFHPMDPHSAGRYHCQYRKYNGWSEHSDALDLVVSGAYDKPSLTVDPDSVVMLGETISFRCSSSANTPFDRFSLTKEGAVDILQHPNEGQQNNFSLGPVNYSFSGSYRCYGWYNASPYVWSSPSNVLELVVQDTMHQDYVVGNLIQLSIAGLVLVALLVILIEDWHSHRCYTKKIGRLDWTKLEEIKVSHKTDLKPGPSGHWKTPGGESIEESELASLR